MTVALFKQQGALIVAGVIKKQLLTPDIIPLVLECLTLVEFFAGQFVYLKRPEGLNPPLLDCKYPAPKHIPEFHLRRLPKGQFSR